MTEESLGDGSIAYLKHEDLSLTVLTQVQKNNRMHVVAGTCNPSTREAGLKGLWGQTV